MYPELPGIKDGKTETLFSPTASNVEDSHFYAFPGNRSFFQEIVVEEVLEFTVKTVVWERIYIFASINRIQDIEVWFIRKPAALTDSFQSLKCFCT